MARKRDPRRNEALKIFVERKGEISNRELASFLNVPEKTISAWKSRDRWNEVLQNAHCSTTDDERSTKNKGGAPFGNQNAKGNKGNSRASPPKGNKNAVKTGEYETIFAEYLTDEEKDIYSTMSDDPFFILNDEIRMLKIRQFRMMKRIKDAEAGLNDEEVQRLQQLRKVKSPIEIEGHTIELKREMLTDVQVIRKTFRKIDDIIAIENALTRVSNQLVRAIKQLNDLVNNTKRMSLLDAQIEYTKSQNFKLNLENNEKLPDEAMEDDGFLEALEMMANDSDIWREETEGKKYVQEN